MNKPREVLYAASNMTHIRNFHLPFIEWLRRRGDDVTVLAHGDGADIDIAMRKSMLAPGNIRAVFEAAKLFKGVKYDLVVLNTSLAAFVLRMGMLLSGKKPERVVNIVHGYLFDRETPAPKRALMIAAEKTVARVTDTIAVMNEYDLDIARRHHLARRGGEIVMTRGMGVDTTRFSPVAASEKAHLREDSPFSSSDIVLACAAEFSKRKNQMFLIESFPSLKKRAPNAKMILAGDGALLEAAKARADALGIAGDIWFVGHSADVERLYRVSDIYVTASKTEGLPLSVMEAMACGLPVVASDVKGHWDLLREGGGELFNLSDPADYLEKAVNMSLNEKKRLQCGQAARDIVSAYEKDKAAKEIVGLFI